MTIDTKRSKGSKQKKKNWEKKLKELGEISVFRNLSSYRPDISNKPIRIINIPLDFWVDQFKEEKLDTFLKKDSKQKNNRT